MTALLEVSGVSVTFDGYRAINNLSFSIGPAELRAIIGPNGAGKTTFMDIVTGKTRPDEGTVLFGDRATSLLGMNEARIARTGIGRKFQRPTVFEDQTVEANLVLALKANRSPWRVLFWTPKPSDMARVKELAEEVGLGDHLHRKSGELSHGQKQWLEIAMLLAQEPRLLLVDEPAAGMTLAEREQTTTLLDPAKAYAKGVGNAVPDIPDPIARHTTDGLLKLKVKTSSSSSVLVGPLFGSSGPGPVTVGNTAAPAVTYAAPAAAVAAPAPQPVKKSEPMLNDTESYFNQGIKDAVAKGDVDKALKLLDEAERLGSKSARSTFISSVKGKG